MARAGTRHSSSPYEEPLMHIINPNSLAETIDNLNEAYFYGRKLAKSEREEAAKWIAARQGLPRSYRGMFAPTDSDYSSGVRLFTGNKVRSGAATAHILSEEASRALILLNVRSSRVQEALQKSTDCMIKAMEYEIRRPGWYCCGICSASLWRHLAVGGLRDPEKELAGGMKELKAHRDGTGKWRRFPFYYTLLALTEIEHRSAVEEMRYTAKVCEEALKRPVRKDKYSIRRHDLLERVMEKL
jgi:hypothetical protein